MFRTITVAIPDEAAAKLQQLAERSYRRPKDQAGLLLVEAIERAEHETPSKHNAARNAEAGR